MKKSEMLNHLKVGGLKYQLLPNYVFKHSPRLLGLHEGDQAKIKLTKQFLTQERTWHKICENLLHEAIHAIDHIYCGCVMTEEEVNIMSNYLYQVIRDNNLNIKKGKLPELIKIGGFTYKVVHPYNFCDGEESSCAVEHEQLLFLMSDEDSSCMDYATGIKMTNLLYLITCAICEMSGIPRGFIYSNKIECDLHQTTFANGLYQVFVDNDLEKFLKSDGEKK